MAQATCCSDLASDVEGPRIETLQKCVCLRNTLVLYIHDPKVFLRTDGLIVHGRFFGAVQAR